LIIYHVVVLSEASTAAAYFDEILDRDKGFYQEHGIPNEWHDASLGDKSEIVETTSSRHIYFVQGKVFASITLSRLRPISAWGG